jgi:tetratricopeptide (TPR) repeat protein
MRVFIKIALWSVLVILFFQTKCFAQAQITMPTQSQPAPTTKDKLAMQFYEQKEFEKANVYFEDLFDSNPYAWYYYYYKSLIGAKEYSKAEKITKKQLKHNKQNVFLYVYLGRVYKVDGDL